MDEDQNQEDVDNIIDIDVSHDNFDVGYHLPLVLGTQYKGKNIFSFALITFIFFSFNHNENDI